MPHSPTDTYDGTESLEQSLDTQTRLARVTQAVHHADSFREVLPEIEDDLLHLLNAERITVYQRGRTDREIVSRFKTGPDTPPIRVPLSTASIAGYVALTQTPLCIRDAQDESVLQRVNPELQYDDSFDRSSGFLTRSVVAVPILYKEVMLGVLQLINKRDGGHFGPLDLRRAISLAKVIGHRFHYELRSTRGPFDYLVLRKNISQAQIQELKARATQERVTLTYLLLSEANLQPAEIGASLEHYYQVPYFGFDPDHELPEDLMRGLNKVYLRKQLWVPVEGDRQRVTILIDDPTDRKRISEIQSVLRADHYVFKVGLPEDILRFLGHDVVPQVQESNISELVERLEEEAPNEETPEEDPEEDLVDENEATVIQFVNRLILEAYRSGASDIHIEPQKGRKALVRFRVDGICRLALEIPVNHVKATVSRIKILSHLDISERRRPQDGKIQVRLRRKTIELRVATLPTVNGEAVVMRLLAASEPMPLEKLNLSALNLERMLEAVSHPHGIFLVVGPTGSGKTTTLHAILGHINTPERKIWTAEDPVEITQVGLQQVQMNPRIGLTFASALRAFLRADPDVIMIGEMRDPETAVAGVEASLTGHLVFSTLHTNSAPETLVRLLDLGIDPVSFADALLGVLAQRLVRTICPECKEPYKAGRAEVEQLERLYGPERFRELGIDTDNLELYRGRGCDNCGMTGYRGRTGVHELLLATPEIRNHIYNKATAAEIKTLAIKQGMRTLLQDGITKVLRGQVDLDQLRRVAV